MTEPCETCTCGIGVDEVDTKRVSFGALSIPTQATLRNEILRRLDLSDDDVFIDEVVVCKEKTTVTYEDRS